MIPGWKLKRELLRLREQFAAIAGRLTGGWRTRQYDAQRGTLVKVREGQQPAAPNVAAFLIFQPGDLPASILQTCEVLAGCGFAVMVVSNGSLRTDSREALARVAWRVVERPNVGYDFGGYREAVMQLQDLGLVPEELVILNDSVWVLPEAFAPFLDAQRRLDADISGAVIRAKDGKRWIESYFYLIRRGAFLSEAFRRFWAGYRLVDSKFAVIRRGERDFSVAMVAGGLRLDCLADNAAFLDRMAQADDGTLRQVLGFHVAPTPDLAAALGDLSDPGRPGWREAASGYLASVLSTHGRVWNSQFPFAAHRLLGHPFVKKSLEPLNAKWRALFITAVNEGVLDLPSEVVWREMQERQAKGVSATPHWLTRRR